MDVPKAIIGKEKTEYAVVKFSRCCFVVRIFISLSNMTSTPLCPAASVAGAGVAEGGLRVAGPEL